MTKRSTAPVIEEDFLSSTCTLFNESQFHVSSHRKNIQSLRKLHAKAASLGVEGETRFLQAICHCLHVILGIKKADDVSNKLLRFLVGFIVRSADGVTQAPETGEFVDRFIEGLMGHVLDHLDAKEKIIRARLCQVMVACLNSIQELTDELWTVFRVKMTERLFDKEAVVRVHAIHSMSRLQSLPVEDDSEMTIMDIFLDLLQHDPAADVRRAALLQVQVCERSLPVILERRRDVDIQVRRLFFSKKMAEIDVNELSIQQRDEILKAGLTDREQSVRQACSDMIFENWMPKTGGNLIQFLVGLDVVANTQVAEVSLKNFFDKLPDMLEGNFTSQFMESMTAEMAFILRVYCEHKIALAKGELEGVQEILPELSVMNGYLRAKYDSIVTCSDDVVRAEVEFVLNELIRVCNWLDFGDEVGRRTVFETCQEIMSNLEICDAVYGQCIRLLTDHAANTQECLDLMTQFISGFREIYEKDNNNNQDAELYDSYIPDDVRIMANLKALEIVRSVLSGSGVSFAKYPILVAYLDEIVIPSVNSQFAAVQAAGLKCLGLCCSIEKGLALEYMSLFCDFYRLGHEDGRLCALQIIFDLFFLYGKDYFNSTEQETSALEVLSSALYDPDEAIQNVAAEGFSKLFLHRIICEEAVLEGLFHLYLHPATSGPKSAALKQCLSYFFQAFAFTSPPNQLMVCGLLGRVLGGWARMHQQAGSKMSISSVASQLLYLADSGNLIDKHGLATHSATYARNYAQIGIDLCWAVLAGPQEEQAKALISVLVKLPLCRLESPTLPHLKQLLFLTTQLMKYVTDKNSLNALKRFSATLLQLDDQDWPLDGDAVNEMRSRLVEVLPAGISVNVTGNNNNNSNANNANSHVNKKVKLSANTQNIMDEITDLLDE